MKSRRVRQAADLTIKAAGVMTAIAVVIATIGIPLPVSLVKDLSKAFPCMNCSCGCVNAQMCWRECCCMSNTEKIAWAHKNGVEIPEYVVQVESTAGCPTEQDIAKLRLCCREKALAGARSTYEGALKSDNSEAAPTGIPAFQALKCQGNALSLSLIPPSVPVDLSGGLLAHDSGTLLSLTAANHYRPPTFDMVVPPPELAYH